MKVLKKNRTLDSFVILLWLAFFFSCTKENTLAPLKPVIPSLSCQPNVVTGYTDKSSYYPEEVIKALLQSSKAIPLCALTIYDANNQIAFQVPATIFLQIVNPINPSQNGYGFINPVEIPIPADLASGIYLIENKIPFIVKTKKPVDLLVVYPSNTVNAYNSEGGQSLYTTNHPFKVSFLRPTSLQSNAAYCLTWFSSLKNISIGYVADIDLDQFNEIEKSKILVIVGHSEYWTRRARNNFDQFINSGKHALILSGNTMWWQVRYTPNRNEMICYRDAAIDIEPDPALKTIVWAQPSLNYSILSSIGADFNYGGFGLKMDNGWDGFKITTPSSPLLNGTNLKKGEIMSLPSGEYDGTPLASFDVDGYPIINNDILNFHKIELIGFDKGSRGGKETIGTFIVFQRSSTSGIIVNTASYDWCSEKGMGGTSADRIKTITTNAIDILLNNKVIFSK